MSKKYINYKSSSNLETVEEIEIKTVTDRKELKRLLSEYRLSDKNGLYYISQRCCKNWN